MGETKSLLKRRQFLLAAAGSTCALTCAGIPALVAAEKVSAPEGSVPATKPEPQAPVAAAIASLTGQGSTSKYSHLLSPLRIGNVVLKNRMSQSDSFPRYLMGLEDYPTEPVIDHYVNVAKNGCAIVMCFGVSVPQKGNASAGGPPGGGPGEPKKEVPAWLKGLRTGEIPHTAQLNRDSITTQHYISQMVEAIHLEGSKAAVGIHLDEWHDYNISKVNVQPGPMGTDGPTTNDGNEIPEKEIQRMCEDVAAQAQYYKALGFDMVNFHMSYQMSILAQSLSSNLNKRTDKYGGSLENRARLPLEIFQTIKKACGQDFLIGAHISGEDRSGGYSVQDAAEFAKLWAGALDILVIRGKDENASHPNGYNFTKSDSPILRYAETIKKGKGNAPIVISVNGGFQDPDLNEEAIASGKTDMITMARAWFADPDYGQKIMEGRGEDVAPCLRCAECHGSNDGPWYQYCSVNPKFGNAIRGSRMMDAQSTPKKVAVIGGGPAGMMAAITAAQRGHKVALYERSAVLGGQLRFTDSCSFKWPYKDQKDYLIRQVKKSGVEVHLNTKATPEMIQGKGYDAVILALGAEPYIPEDIPGAKGNVWAPMFVYGDEHAVSKNVVVIGGDQIATDTAMHLAQKGHKVTVLTSEKALASDASEFINWDLIRLYQSLEKQGSFSYITEAKVKNISAGSVTYVDAKGAEKTLATEGIVLYAGRKPRQEEAMKFAGTAKRFFIVGDCKFSGIVKSHWDGNVAISIRSGYWAGSEV